MKNPWLKKNPFMSLWLSGVNKVAGAARGQATVAIKREVSLASKETVAAATKQVLDGLGAASGGSTTPKAKRRR